MPPDQISGDMVRPRFSMLDSYSGKSELEVGMGVRLKWSTKYDRRKATVMGIGSNLEEMNLLFDELEKARIAKVRNLMLHSSIKHN